MFTINEIKGEGNSHQQDRAGKLEGVTEDGTPVFLMWVLDGHGTRVGYHRYDLGGIVAQTGEDILKSLDAESILRIFNDTEFGKELFANIQSKIEAKKDAFLTSNGWSKLTDATGDDIDVLWSKVGTRIATPGGGTTLILVSGVKEGDTWNARMYNVGDSMMVFNDVVYSQAGIDGLNEETVIALAENSMKTAYSSVPGSISPQCFNYHEISVIDTAVSINSPPTPIGGRHRYYCSNVRGEIATEVKLTYIPKMFELKDPHRFHLNTNLASWSNMGDSQNAKWASVPSYSKPFVIDGPLSLTSDGIGDILKSELDASSEEKTGWFNYYSDHPMNTSNPEKNNIFKNSWFHETVMGISHNESATEAVLVHDDPFYRVAKLTFGVADNISRVTFMP